MEEDLFVWQMEDDLNILLNGIRPKFVGKCKTTSIYWQMEDDLNYLFTEEAFQFLKQEIQKQYQH